MQLPSVIGSTSAAFTLALASADGFTPVGSLNIDTSLVREGAPPLLSWQISFPPPTVDKVVDIEPDNAVRTKSPVYMTVRVLGAPYRPYGENAAVNLQVKLGYRGDWETAFHGIDHQIDPSETVFAAEVASDTIVDIAGAGNLSGNRWTSSRNTLTKTSNVVALKNGDAVPPNLMAFQRGEIKDHVSAYVQNGRIALGPNELIYLIELGQSDPARPDFDMQDLVAVASFEPVVTERLTNEEGHNRKDQGVRGSSLAPDESPTLRPSGDPRRVKGNHKPLRTR